jgi:glycosyltransferase involved in cell wall biosynthesis
VDKVLKIVHVITRLVLGGAQENTLITCRLLARRGHEVTLITGPAAGPEGGLFHHTGGGGYRVITVNELVRPVRCLADVSAYRKVKRHLRRLGPDVVHTHSAKAGIIGRLAAHALKDSESRPAVVHTIHGLAFGPYQNRLLNALCIAAERYAAKRTDFFISVADAVSARALDAGIGRPGRFVTAYSAFDEQPFLRGISDGQRLEFRRRYGIPGDAVVLVAVARLFRLKGHDYIIDSAVTLAKRFEKAVWLFVGGGNLAGRLAGKVRRLGLSGRFRFTGLLAPEEIPAAIHSCDILVHCSLREGLARALGQAMLCGRPVVTFAIDGVSELVTAENGRSVEVGDIGGLTESCSELIADAALRRRLGDAGRSLAREKFNPERMVDTIEAVYRRVVKW